jgi:hypothetical protein
MEGNEMKPTYTIEAAETRIKELEAAANWIKWVLDDVSDTVDAEYYPDSELEAALTKKEQDYRAEATHLRQVLTNFIKTATFEV